MGIYLVMLFKVHLFICGTEHECLASGYARAYFDVLCRVLLGQCRGLWELSFSIEVRTEVILSNERNV
jgi:hypothetical protein